MRIAPRRLLLAGTVTFFVVRVLLTIPRTGPVVVADEVGYLANARVLAGGVDGQLSPAPFYHGGYSLLLAPLLAIFRQPGDELPARARSERSYLRRRSLRSSICLLTRCFAVQPAAAVWPALAAAAYPSVTIYTQVAMSENLLLPLLVLWLLCAGSFLQARTPNRQFALRGRDGGVRRVALGCARPDDRCRWADDRTVRAHALARVPRFVRRWSVSRVVAVGLVAVHVLDDFLVTRNWDGHATERGQRAPFDDRERRRYRRLPAQPRRAELVPGSGNARRAPRGGTACRVARVAEPVHTVTGGARTRAAHRVSACSSSRHSRSAQPTARTCSSTAVTRTSSCHRCSRSPLSDSDAVRRISPRLGARGARRDDRRGGAAAHDGHTARTCESLECREPAGADVPARPEGAAARRCGCDCRDRRGRHSCGAVLRSAVAPLVLLLFLPTTAVIEQNPVLTAQSAFYPSGWTSPGEGGRRRAHDRVRHRQRRQPLRLPMVRLEGEVRALQGQLRAAAREPRHQLARRGRPRTTALRPTPLWIDRGRHADLFRVKRVG